MLTIVELDKDSHARASLLNLDLLGCSWRGRQPSFTAHRSELPHSPLQMTSWHTAAPVLAASRR